MIQADYIFMVMKIGKRKKDVHRQPKRNWQSDTWKNTIKWQYISEFTFLEGKGIKIEVLFYFEKGFGILDNKNPCSGKFLLLFSFPKKISA